MQCDECDGDGAVPITPVEEDGGVVWSIVPCEKCNGTGVLLQMERQPVHPEYRISPLHVLERVIH